MEEKIKVGDFLKTKGGIIAQVLKIIPPVKFITTKGHVSSSPEKYYIDNKKGSISKPYVENFSDNILELLQVGDIVNGYRIDNIGMGFVECCNKTIYFTKEEIKIVLTKEEYLKKGYVVKEE